MAAFSRINGFPTSSVLGFFQGKNALASIAIGSAGSVAVKDTGAVATLVQLQNFLNSTDDQVLVTYLNGKGIVRVDGTAFILASVEADYTASYAAQTNLKRIVDVVQQRAVIIAASTLATASVTNFVNAPAGVLTTTAAVTTASVITFLVERATVFDKNAQTFQGVPTGVTEEGRLLVDDLTNVTFMSATGTDVVLLSSATAGAVGNFGVKIYKQIPAQYL